MVHFVPFFRPDFAGLELEALKSTLNSRWLTNGPQTQALELSFARTQQSISAIAVSSGTAALHLALLAAGISEGDEVITSTFTFAATCNAIIHCGAMPVLADVEPETLNLNPECVIRAITSRTRAIVVVHFGGNPADMSVFEEICRKRSLIIINDSAHAVEALLDNKPISRFGNATCFSFYATKNMGIGEGGMVLCADPTVEKRIRSLRSHGMDIDAWTRGATDSVPNAYDIVEPGFNYKMSEIQATLALYQLHRLDENWTKRRTLVARYDDAFCGRSDMRTLCVRPNARSAHHLYVLLLSDGCTLSRDQLVAHLKLRGIATAVHYRPIHQLSYYRRNYEWNPGQFPVATSAGTRCISLPLYPSLSLREQDYVISAMLEALHGA
jgi:dTDP-4-amino-4,6-dideoxygalactose transaminase